MVTTMITPRFKVGDKVTFDGNCIMENGNLTGTIVRIDTDCKQPIYKITSKRLKKLEIAAVHLYEKHLTKVKK